MPRFRFRSAHLARRIGLHPHGETDVFTAATLGDAIAVASRMLDARIVPHDEGKWFRIYLSDLPPDEYALSDIHIHRDGDWFCPRQDTSVTLRPDDIVAFEPLVC